MRLLTLGTFELVTTSADGATSRVLGPQKPLALLAYLSLAPRRSATRDQLVEVLWSGAERDRARQTLRQSVWHLRQHLGEGAIASRDEWLTLVSPLPVDCLEFERAAGAGDLHGAWETYRGAFLSGFVTHGGPEFDHWAEGHRERLRQLWLQTGLGFGRSLLDQRRHRDAAAVYRALRDEFPDQLELWRHLLTALDLAGDRLQAATDAAALEVRLRASPGAVDPGFRAVIERLRVHNGPSAGTRHKRIVTPLVGRDEGLVALWEGWERVSTGRLSTIALRGSAGLGKTRLLSEFRSRLEELGAPVVTVEARPADRDLPYALIADLAQRLAGLPGALGISSASASLLLELAPQLSSVFRHAPAARSSSDEMLRQRMLAVAELVQATAEEQPLAILVDDLHWSDDQSRQLLTGLLERLRDTGAFIVIAFRPMRGGWSLPKGSRVLDLPPLTRDQVEQVLRGIAPADGGVSGPVAALVHTASGGLPLLVIAAIELALDHGLLRIRDGGWECQDLDRLAALLAMGGVLEQALRELPAGGSAVLLALAVAGRPLPHDVLVESAGPLTDQALFGLLEQRGLIIQAAAGWSIGHDRVAEAAWGMISNDERTLMARRLGRALLDRGTAEWSLRLAGRLLVLAGDPHGIPCFHAWLAAHGSPGDWRQPDMAAWRFLGDHADLERTQRLVSSLPIMNRITRGHPRMTMAAGIALLLTPAVIALGALRPVDPPAVGLQLSEVPHSSGFLWAPISEATSVDVAPTTNPAPISVTFLDAAGERTLSAPDSVEVALVGHSPDLRLTGTTMRPVLRGQADFPDLAIQGRGPFQLEFRAGGLPPQRTQVLYSADVRAALNIGTLRIHGGVVNGQALGVANREVVVAPGDTIVGELRLASLTTTKDATILLGAIAFWGDRRTNWIVLRPLPSHGSFTGLVQLKDAVSGLRLKAPARPGRYRIVLVADADLEMRFIASRTNWMLGTPRWFDANDVVEMGPVQFAALDSIGRVDWPRLAQGNRPGTVAREIKPLLGATLTVVVRDEVR